MIDSHNARFSKQPPNSASESGTPQKLMPAACWRITRSFRKQADRGVWNLATNDPSLSKNVSKGRNVGKSRLPNLRTPTFPDGLNKRVGQHRIHERNLRETKIPLAFKLSEQMATAQEPLSTLFSERDF